MLKVGDDFYGFRVERSEDTQVSHIYVFERRGKYIQLEMKTNDYISLILDEHARIDIQDAMLKQLCDEYGCKVGQLDGAWGGL